MDPVTSLSQLLVSLGYGAFVPVLLAIIGLFSAVSTVYKPTWPGASTVHTLALLTGHAVPAVVPASVFPETTTKGT